MNTSLDLHVYMKTYTTGIFFSLSSLRFNFNASLFLQVNVYFLLCVPLYSMSRLICLDSVFSYCTISVLIWVFPLSLRPVSQQSTRTRNRSNDRELCKASEHDRHNTLGYDFKVSGDIKDGGQWLGNHLVCIR